MFFVYVFFFKQKTAYEMRISDWSSDVCSSDLGAAGGRSCGGAQVEPVPDLDERGYQIAHHRFVMRRAGREAQPFGAARHRGIVDRLDVDAVFGEQHVAALLGLDRIADQERKSVVEGKSVSVRVDLGGRRVIKKNKKQQ